MKFKQEHESFIQDFLEAIEEKRAAIFAGAGLSAGAGFVDWKGLLGDIASDLGLDINKEDDLISVAQYHTNEKNGRSILNKKILRGFTEEIELTDNHRILARLPIDTYWTTNYDALLENALEEYDKIVDVKHQVNQLPNSKPKRDAVIYKMHGDAEHSSEAIITRDDYEKYFLTHEPFVNALKGDLTTRTFLFIGFSFNDPNLEYALSRVRLHFGTHASHHYCFIKRLSQASDESKADFEYKVRKQELRIGDLKTYQIHPILVDSYEEITAILNEIERRFKLKSIFISGSAEEYGDWGKERAIKMIHKLSSKLISKHYRIVNGFGWGIGSAVINGALEQIYSNSKRFSGDQLVLRPFPQFPSGSKELPELWKDYREKMISLTGIALFVFGNKLHPTSTEIVKADGVKKEFDIALAQGCLPIPLGSTGYMASELNEYVISNFEKIYGPNESLRKELNSLATETNAEKLIQTVIKIIEILNSK